MNGGEFCEQYPWAPLSDAQIEVLDKIDQLLQGDEALLSKFRDWRALTKDAVVGCPAMLYHVLDLSHLPASELKQAVWSQILELCPFEVHPSWKTWNGVGNSAPDLEIYDLFGYEWTELEKMDISAWDDHRAEFKSLLGNREVPPSSIAFKPDLEDRATSIAQKLSARSSLKCKKENASSSLEDRRHPDFVFSLEDPSDDYTVRISHSCLEMTIVPDLLKSYWEKRKPWTSLRSVDCLSDFMNRALIFFKPERNRSLDYLGVLTDLDHFIFLKTGRNGLLLVSNPMTITVADDDELVPLRVLLSLLRSQKSIMEAATGVRYFPLRVDFEPLVHPQIVDVRSENGSTIYTKVVGTLGATKSHLILACTAAKDETDWTSESARFSHLFCLKLAAIGNKDAVKALDIEEFHLKNLKHCPCVPHVLGKGSLVYDSPPNRRTMCIGLLLDLVGLPLDHMDVSRFSVDDFKALWSAMKSALSQIHSFGVVHGNLKPSHFILTRSGINIIDFSGTLTNWSACLFPKEEGSELSPHTVFHITPMFASPSILLNEITTAPTRADDCISLAYSLISLMIHDSTSVFKLPENHQKNPSSLIDLVRDDCKRLATHVLTDAGLFSHPLERHTGL